MRPYIILHLPIMKYLILVILSCLQISLHAQSYEPEKVNKKALALYEKAVIKMQDEQYNDAIPILKEVIEADSKYADAILSLAGVYGELKDYQSAIDYYDKAKLIDTQYFRFYYLPYSINLAGLGRFEEASKSIDQFLTIATLSDRSRKSGNYRKKSYTFAIDYASKHPFSNYVFTPINLGDSVNSEKSEYYPSLTIDDSILVFTRRGTAYREDFIESTILKDKSYSKSKLINGDINIEPNKGAINISQDGEWLIFAGDFMGGYGNFDLYISYNTPTGWSEPENLGSNVNSEFWDTGPSLSPDKRALFFSSTRPDGYGGSDIYVSIRQPNGRWGFAQNMGPSINTAGDEKAPFIHADNATLYFTSDGLPGYGKTDMFMCRKGPDNHWSIPENLGYPINTIEDEGSLFVSSNGKSAYYASDRRDSRGGLDLYTFELRQNVRPAKTLYVKGNVYDAVTGKGLPCAVDLIDNSNRKSVTNLQTDETGNYFITLSVGKDYTFSVNRKGYLFYSDVFLLSKSEPDSTYSKDIALQPITMNAALVMKNILFETNSAILQDISTIEIDKLWQLLNDNPTIKVQINGYTDNVGTPIDNLKLSTNRAKAVVDYLVTKNVDIKRLSYKGFGETKPIADNTSETGRAQNRRTEFVVIGQ